MPFDFQGCFSRRFGSPFEIILDVSPFKFGQCLSFFVRMQQHQQMHTVLSVSHNLLLRKLPSLLNCRSPSWFLGHELSPVLYSLLAPLELPLGALGAYAPPLLGLHASIDFGDHVLSVLAPKMNPEKVTKRCGLLGLKPHGIP